MLNRKNRKTNRHRKARRAASTLRARTASPTDRRGTVLLIALGALGVISLAALSYVTFVRLDRLGSTTHARVANFQQQVDATTDWIGTLLTADLYGNKIPSTTTPRDNVQLGLNANSTVYAWPTRFEDGEYRDHPSTDMRTFAPEPLSTYTGQSSFSKARLELLSTGSTLASGAGLRKFEVAPPDDAFLAQIDPVWNSSSPNEFQWNSLWSQLTNLRSAYVYVDNADDPLNPTPTDLTDDAYIRQDGRYADLGQFFIDSIDLGGSIRANPGALVSVVLPGRRAGESLDVNEVPFAPLNAMDTPSDPQNADLINFNQRDERFMTDTDGDLRADARWQELDALGSLFDYRWFVAARVIDMSGLVNINTATTGNYGAGVAIDSTTDRLPNGKTPADVDLFRLLATSHLDDPGSIWYGTPRYDFASGPENKGIRVDQLAFNAFADHLDNGIGLYEVAVAQGLATAGGITSFNPNNSASYIPQSFRDAHYLLAGANPESPATPGARRYPVTEMIDLSSFAGTNQRSLVSRLEERIDGPLDSRGYLPSPSDTMQTVFGPLESAAKATDQRRFPETSGELPRPSALALRFGPRRHLTTVSGAANFSPVPTLNLDALDPNGDPLYQSAQSENEPRINLASLSSNTDNVNQVFESFLWALAPLSFNEPISADLTRPDRDINNRGNTNVLSGARLATNASGLPGNPMAKPTMDDPFLSDSFHYGGGLNGEARRLFGDTNTSVSGGFSNAGLGLMPSVETSTTGATYAVFTALQLTANTVDAFDTDSRPTVLRFLPTDTGLTAAADPDTAFVEDVRDTGAIELGTRWRTGEIPSALLDPRVLGRQITSVDARNIFFENENSTSGAAGSTIAILNSGNGGMPDFDLPNVGTGLTVVGLERQPYLTEGVSVAIYSNEANDNALNAAGDSNYIDPDAPEYQVGSFLAFELHNPWPQTIPGGAVDDLEIWILNPSSAGELIDDPAAPPLKLEFTRGAPSIPAGGSITLAYFYDAEDGDKFINAENIGFAGVLLANGAVEMQPADSFSDPSTGAVNPVFFETWAGTGPGGAGARVMLMRNVPELELPAVIDTLTGPRGEEFPAILDDEIALIGDLPVGGNGALSGGFNAAFPDSAILLSDTNSDEYTRIAVNEVRTNPNTNSVRGRVAVTSSLSRTMNTPAGTGLSSAILDFGGDASVIQKNDIGDTANPPSDVLAHVWIEEIVPPAMPGRYRASFGSLSLLIDAIVDDLSSLGDQTTTFADDAVTVGIPAWEVLIPAGTGTNARGVFSKADLALISKHAHVCINHRLNRLDSWITAGQQLAAEARSASFNTSSLGVLDLTSSLPGLAGGTASGIYPNQSPEGVIPDESLALPLALRVFEPFEALSPAASGNRFNGRININTATERTIEALPWVAPRVAHSNLGTGASGTRARAMMAYRDGIDPRIGVNPYTTLGGNDAVITPEAITGLTSALIPTDPDAIADNTSLRRSDLRSRSNGIARAGAPNIGHGFATPAELAILDTWTSADPAGTQNFLATPNPSPAMGSYFDILGPGFVREHALDATDALGIDRGVFGVDSRENYNVPANGQAQRIALYRALANIVETRSDVFGAWFVLRGYDPDVIESIPVDTGDPLLSMEDDRFNPAYETRWFVLFDRSNVSGPTDQPEVLLQVQLPSITP